MRKLSKSMDEYMAAGGWSSHYFFGHAKDIFANEDVKAKCAFEIGRHVIYIRKGDKLLKAYVHADGRTREYMTFKTASGEELKTFHYTVDTQEIIDFMLDYLESEA